MDLPLPNGHSPEKVLLVDDVPANLTVLAATLEHEGYEILAVPNGSTALKVASKAQPRLILLDILMPGLDGLETCRRLKEDPLTKDIPVIFLTARGDTESIVGGFRGGGVDYIIKPFQTEEVASRVATHLQVSRLTRQLIENNRALAARTAQLTAEIERRRQVESALQSADDKLAAFSDVEASRGSLAGLVGESPPVRQ